MKSVPAAAFPVRGLNLVESLLRHTPEQLRRYVRRMRNLQLNTLIVQYDYGWSRHRDLLLEETAAAGVEICLMTFAPRSFLRLVDWKPAWLAKKADGSLLTDKLVCETQLCAAQPEAVEGFAEGAARWLAALPPAIRRVHVRCGDGIHFCECPHCRRLDEGDRWAPFLNAFAHVVRARAPHLQWEMDVYARRYRIPEDRRAFAGIDRVMYDTFFRCASVPIGQEGWREDCLSGCTSEPNPDAREPNVWHDKRMREWTQFLPGKVYVHENLMGQALLGVMGQNTGAQLQDLRTYRDLGIQGVCYEAYEPGFGFFEKQIETLSAAMLDPEAAADHPPTALERELASGRWKMPWFCSDPAFPVERFFDDPVERAHVRNYAEFVHRPTAASMRRLVEFMLAGGDRFDWIMGGFFGCEWGRAIGGVDFSACGEETRFMLSHRKLWDFMEGLPADVDPRERCRMLILDALEHARDGGKLK